MQSNPPLVSIIVIFYNAEAFIREAVQSVLAQTYSSWELLLVDDGSSDGSTQIALDFAAGHPEKIFVLEHPGHLNRGKTASRNLGIFKARGDYIAFLDADDAWLPEKLAQQTNIMNAHPAAGMLYGDTLYWFSWTGAPEDHQKDFVPVLGVETNTLLQPPKVLPLYLLGRAAVPCTCSVLVRRNIALEVGGFEENYPGIENFYEDQAFYAKVCLVAPVVAVNTCWDQYRQRAGSNRGDIARIALQERAARRVFLRWLGEYMSLHGFEDQELRRAIRREQWLIHIPGWLPDTDPVQVRVRWLKKWILRVWERFLPV